MYVQVRFTFILGHSGPFHYVLVYVFEATHGYPHMNHISFRVHLLIPPIFFNFLTVGVDGKMQDFVIRQDKIFSLQS